MKRLLQKLGAMIAGFAVTALLYGTIGFWILHNVQTSTGGSPEAVLPLAFNIVLPTFLLLGSFLTGRLLRAFTRHPIIDGLFFAPGVWMAAFFLIMNRPDIVALSIFVIPPLVWIAVSWLGVGSGMIRRRKPDRATPTRPEEYASRP